MRRAGNKLKRVAPYAFTEQSVAMLASVLCSDRVIHQRVFRGNPRYRSGEFVTIESFVQGVLHK